MRNKQKVLLWLSKHENNIIAKNINRFYEPVSYLIFGVLTTLVNMLIYTILEHILGQKSWYFSNLPAIFLAILFAYITNRSFVFDSEGDFWTEMYKFFSARILISFVFEYATTFVLFNILNFDFQLDFFYFKVSLFKIASQVMVIVGNYIVSKVFIFKTTKKGNNEVG